MRDTAVAGPDLTEIRRLVGRYLVLEFLADVIGLEWSPIRHVLGGFWVYRSTPDGLYYYFRQS